MTPQQIEQLISDHISGAEVSVSETEGKFTATVISQQFDGLMTLKRHKLVYAAVNDAITSGELHALTIIAKTPDEAA